MQWCGGSAAESTLTHFPPHDGECIIQLVDSRRDARSMVG